jgi:hypothetical protein
MFYLIILPLIIFAVDIILLYLLLKKVFKISKVPIGTLALFLLIGSLLASILYGLFFGAGLIAYHAFVDVALYKRFKLTPLQIVYCSLILLGVPLLFGFVFLKLIHIQGVFSY